MSFLSRVQKLRERYGGSHPLDVLVGAVSDRLHMVWSGNQTAAPAEGENTALLVQWHSTIDHAGQYGPETQSSLFGPRGVVTQEGVVRYARNHSIVTLGPLGTLDMLAVGNDAGNDRTINPGWAFLATRIHFADGAVVTQERNDTALGMASFMDNTVYLAVNGGTWDGSDNVHIGFLSHPFILAGATMDERIGYQVVDASYQDGAVGVDEDDSAQLVADRIGLGTATPGLGTINTQVGVDIRHLEHGNANVGIRNASTVQNVPLTVAVTDSTTLPVTASLLDLSTAANRTLTSTPTIPDGVDGQTLAVRNASDHLITFQDENVLASSNLRLATPTRRIAPREMLSFTYDGSWGLWVEDGGSMVAAGESPPFMSRTHSVAQTIPNATWTTLQFNTGNADVHGPHWDGVNHRWVPPRFGVVQLRAAVSWAANGAGRRKIRLRSYLQPFSVALPFATGDVAASGEANQMVDVMALSRVDRSYSLANQWIEVQVYQDSGGPLDVTVDGLQSPLFGLTYIPPF